MSHFTVAIITKGKPTREEIDKVLAPYQENNMGDCPREYMEWNSVTKEYKEEYENDTVEKVRMPDGRLLNTWDDEFRVAGSIGIGSNTHKVPEDLPVEEIPYKELYSTFDEYMSDWCGYEFDEEMQDYGYWENPNAKWDWYQIGGRWAGMLETSIENKDVGIGEKSWYWGDKNPYEIKGNIQQVDAARVKDIITNNPEKYQKKIRFWELYIEKQRPQNDEEKDMIEREMYNEQYYINKYGTKERYAELESTFYTWAVITKDGEWHEPGTMGWFACSSASADEEVAFIENYKKVVFDNAEDDDYMTIVDCHI